jgi:hypothetical protein
LAKCTLDLNHPYFLRAIGSSTDGQELPEGLKAAKEKIEAEHTSCHHVVQQMPGYPQCQNKIWKYDWSPPGQRSKNRKCWRMVVIVPDPTHQPYRLIAAAIYGKNAPDQLSNKQLAKIFAAVTALPAAHSPNEEEQFQHVAKDGGSTLSLCRSCGETIASQVTAQPPSPPASRR